MPAVTPSPDRLPTFFVIGAPKCGTTSLHGYLDQHPGIAMTSRKEPFVFAGEDWRRRLGEYGPLFSKRAPVRGESSTVYSQHPEYAGVPERIGEAVPEARFIYLVGDPVDRAVAHYRQHVADGKESRPLAAALADHAEADSTYLAASRYATQLGRYLARFDATRILVLDREELLNDHHAALARAFTFLGVDPGPAETIAEHRLNRAQDLRPPTALGRLLGGSAPLEAARRVALPAAVRRPLRRLLSRAPVTEELAPALRERVADSLRDEVSWLRDYTGMRFASWSL